MELLISTWIDSEIIDSITYTIIHSIWQGAVIALIAFVLFQKINNDRPIQKYRIALLGIFSLFICSGITFFSNYFTGQNIGQSDVSDTISEWTISTIYIDESISSLSNIWIGYLWIIGVTIFSIKFLFDLGVVQFIRYSALKTEESRRYEFVIDDIQNESNSSVALRVSQIVQAPVTIGFFKPIILFPVGMLTQLTIAEVESILRHELAHIVRKDYLVNIIQSLMEIVLFYHPLVWWLSKVAREEREFCCDDVALASNGEAIDYAKTLVRIQELVHNNKRTLAMSFADQSLMNRIKRIMNLPKTNRNMREKLIAITAVLALLVFASKDMIANATDRLWSRIEMENTDVPREEIVLDMEVMPIDTLPTISKHSYSMTKSDDNGSITIKKEDGKITKLEIDGKNIPESQYDQYQEEIDEMEGGNSQNSQIWMFSDGEEIDMSELEEKMEKFGIEMEDWGERLGESFGEEFGSSMEEWGERFGQSMEGWGEQFGDSFEMHFDDDSLRSYSFVVPEMDSEVMERLEDIMGDIDMEGMTGELQEMLKGLDLEGLQFRGLEPNNRESQRGFSKNSNVEDKIGYELRKDRLIASGEVSEVELSGKHMKINGEKQPTNIWNKYRSIFEETSGIVLSKDSKLKFNVEGKKTMKKTSAF